MEWKRILRKPKEHNIKKDEKMLKIIINKGNLEKREQSNHLDSIITNDGRCVNEIKAVVKYKQTAYIL